MIEILYTGVHFRQPKNHAKMTIYSTWLLTLGIDVELIIGNLSSTI